MKILLSIFIVAFLSLGIYFRIALPPEEKGAGWLCIGAAVAATGLWVYKTIRP